MQEQDLAPEFDLIYEEISRRFGHEAPDVLQSRATAQTKMQVEKAIRVEELHENVRPDARLYLYANAYYMVVLPLIETAEIHNLDQQQIFDNVYKDTRQILKEARIAHNNRVGAPADALLPPNARLTGHDVLNATSRTYNKLSSTQTSIWSGADTTEEQTGGALASGDACSGEKRNLEWNLLRAKDSSEVPGKKKPHSRRC